MSPWRANSSVMRWIASSSAPMSNCMSASGGRPRGWFWSWEVADIAGRDDITDNSRLFLPAGPDANESRRRRVTQYPLQEGDPVEASDDSDAALRLAPRLHARRRAGAHVLGHVPRGARHRR